MIFQQKRDEKHISKSEFDQFLLLSNDIDIQNKSNAFVCFHCFKHFEKDKLIDQKCPHCSHNAIIGNGTDLPIQNTSFLQHMHFYKYDHIWSSDGKLISVRNDNMATHCIFCTFVGHLDHVEEIKPKEVIKIVKLEMTSEICPCQWIGETIDGSDVLVRERSNVLTISIDGEIKLLLRTNRDFYGMDSLIEYTKGFVEFLEL